MSAQAPFFPIIALCVHTHAWNVECLLHAADIYGWMGNYLFIYGKDFGLSYPHNYANDIQNYSLLHLECLYRPFFSIIALCVHTHAWNVECLLHAADIYGWMGNYLFIYGKDFGLSYPHNYANDIQNYSLLHLECLFRSFFSIIAFCVNAHAWNIEDTLHAADIY